MFFWRLPRPLKRKSTCPLQGSSGYAYFTGEKALAFTDHMVIIFGGVETQPQDEPLELTDEAEVNE